MESPGNNASKASSRTTSLDISSLESVASTPLKTDIPEMFAGIRHVIGYIGEIHRMGPFTFFDQAEFFVRLDNNNVLRYPHASMNDLAHLERHLSKPLVYDGSTAKDIPRLAGFRADNGGVSYCVGKTAVEPIARHNVGDTVWQAYQLSNGHYLVLQPGIFDCTWACEAALLMHHGLKLDQAVPPSGVSGARDFDKIAISLRNRLENVKPILIQGDIGSEEGKHKFARALQENTEKHGPGIFSRHGHVSMLYSIKLDASGGIDKAEIGDPFHGTHVMLPDGLDLWACHNHAVFASPSVSKIVNALFLPSRSSSSDA